MVTLPEAGSATDLIPGNPVAVAEHATHLRAIGVQADEVGRRLRAVATDEWSGEAAEAFRHAFSGEPGRWFAAADSLTDAADALERYSVALATAQGQAESALAMWRLGVLKTRGAQVAWTRQGLTDAPAFRRPVEVPSHEGAFVDPGHMRLVAAHDALYRARRELEIEVRLLVGVLRGEADCAPRPEPLDARVGRVADELWRGLERVGAAAANAVASAGNAALHHPLDALSVVAGADLLDVGIGGAAAGSVATATGVGAPVGLPAVAVSAAAVAAGAGLVAVGGRNLVMHATSDDAVHPVAGPAPAPSTPAAPTRISGWTNHGLARIGERRVFPEAMVEAVEKPSTPPVLQDNGTFRFDGPRAVVVLNPQGAVVTTWATKIEGMVQP